MARPAYWGFPPGTVVDERGLASATRAPRRFRFPASDLDLARLERRQGRAPRIQQRSIMPGKCPLRMLETRGNPKERPQVPQCQGDLFEPRPRLVVSLHQVLDPVLGFDHRHQGVAHPFVCRSQVPRDLATSRFEARDRLARQGVSTLGLDHRRLRFIDARTTGDFLPQRQRDRATLLAAHGLGQRRFGVVDHAQRRHRRFPGVDNRLSQPLDTLLDMPALRRRPRQNLARGRGRPVDPGETPVSAGGKPARRRPRHRRSRHPQKPVVRIRIASGNIAAKLSSRAAMSAANARPRRSRASRPLR